VPTPDHELEYFRDLERLLAGSHRATSKQQSIVFFSMQRAGSSIVGEIALELALALGLTPIDYERYKGWYGHFVSKAVYREQGYYFGPYRYYSDHVPHLERYRVILMLRDPRDVLTSWFFSMAYSHAVDCLDDRNRQSLISKRQRALELGVDDYVLESADWYLAQYGIYCDCLLQRPFVHFCRYEDMVTDFGGWLADLAQFIGLGEQEPLLAQIASRHAGKAEKEDPARHMRQVTPGDHRRKLRTGTIRALNSKFAGVLGTLGYGLLEDLQASLTYPPAVAWEGQPDDDGALQLWSSGLQDAPQRHRASCCRGGAELRVQLRTRLAEPTAARLTGWIMHDGDALHRIEPQAPLRGGVQQSEMVLRLPERLPGHCELLLRLTDRVSGRELGRAREVFETQSSSSDVAPWPGPDSMLSDAGGAAAPVVQLIRVHYVGAEAQPSHSFLVGEGLEAVIWLRVNRPVRAPLIRVQLFSIGQRALLFGTNTRRQGLELGELAPGYYAARLRLEELNLSAGAYWITVGVWPDEAAGEAFDLRESAFPFTIHGEPSDSTSVVHQPCHWIVEATASDAAGGGSPPSLGDLRLQDQSGHATATFASGAMLRATVQVALLDPSEVRLVATLRREGMLLHVAECPRPLPRESASAQLVYEPLNLLGGSHELIVTLLSRTTGEPLAALVAPLTLISEPRQGAGLARHEASWSMRRLGADCEPIW
jgi:hypothetical protein